MAELYIDLRRNGALDLEPVIEGVRQLTNPDDTLNVVVSRLEIERAEPIAEIMREAGLEVQTRGGQDEEFIIRGYFRP